MKKYLCLGFILMAMASCGSSETKNETTNASAEPDTFGMEMPIEALESTTPYEGIGNMSDGAE